MFTFSIRFSHASISTLHLFIFRAHFIFRLPVTPLMRFPSAQFDVTSLNRDNCPSWQVYCNNRQNTRINELLIDNATDQGVFSTFFFTWERRLACRSAATTRSGDFGLLKALCANKSDDGGEQKIIFRATPKVLKLRTRQKRYSVFNILKKTVQFDYFFEQAGYRLRK